MLKNIEKILTMPVKFTTGIRAGRADKNGYCHVEIVIYNLGKYAFVKTGVKVRPEHWIGEVVKGHASYELNRTIQTKLADIVRKSLEVPEIDRLFPADIIRQIDNRKYMVTFRSVCHGKIEHCKATGSTKSASLYLYTLNLVTRLSGEVAMRQITKAWLEELQVKMMKDNLKPSTISVIFRYIRSVYNIAISKELADIRFYPFRNFRIKQSAPSKRALSIDEVRRLLDIRHLATDVFFLSFYLCGANIKDILYAKNEQIADGRLVFARYKTGKEISVYVQPEAWEIINRHPGKVLLLDIMEKRKRLDQFNKYVNKHLKVIAELVGIKKPVTTYYARHSWATIASSLNVNKEVIAAGLGHGSRSVTDTYIDFDIRKVDAANRLIINTIYSSQSTDPLPDIQM